MFSVRRAPSKRARPDFQSANILFIWLYSNIVTLFFYFFSSRRTMRSRSDKTVSDNRIANIEPLADAPRQNAGAALNEAARPSTTWSRAP